MVIGDAGPFPYRSSSFITRFFEECDLDFVHDGSTRWAWTAGRLGELLAEPQPVAHALPERFVNVLRTLMLKSDAADDDPGRVKALAALNAPLMREGFEAYYGEDDLLYVRHIASRTVSSAASPHRPLTPAEVKRRNQLAAYPDTCSEDGLIEEVLLPMFRQLGFHRVTAAGHKDKALEYGKDVWMRFTLPTQHVLYFGIQAKKGKIDAAGMSRDGSRNIAEIHQQVLMMLGHEIFDPETSKKVLVDHAFIVAGGEITKQARNWLGGKLDASKRSQIMFMDRDDILNLFTVSNIPLPASALPPSANSLSDEIHSEVRAQTPIHLSSGNREAATLGRDGQPANLGHGIGRDRDALLAPEGDDRPDGLLRIGQRFRLGVALGNHLRKRRNQHRETTLLLRLKNDGKAIGLGHGTAPSFGGCEICLMLVADALERQARMPGI